MVKNPYSNIPQPGSATNTEAWALIESARRMAESLNHELAPAAMRDAIRLNWRLWTIFQAELTTNEDFPAEIRGNMLSLCAFVDKFSVEAIAEPERRHIDTLVNINRNIAAGLLAGMEKSQQEPTEAPAAAIEQAV